MAIRVKSLEIRQFLVTQIAYHAADIVQFAAGIYRVTPQAIRGHLNALIDDGTIHAEGSTKARRYKLKPLVDVTETLKTDVFAEDVVWTKFVAPHLEGVSRNVSSILNIAVTEMVNNVIDHSGSPQFQFRLLRTASMIDITITDSGVGVFRKVQKAFSLIDERQAILELSKGKLTTAPAEHTGYGIFFTSRMVDLFRMYSGSLFFTHARNSDDWLIGHEADIQGTRVQMSVEMTTTASPQSVYDQFCSKPGESDLGFHKTHVPLMLAQFGNELLVSRSQAKRVLARVDKFTEVMLNFNGVEFVGQAFIDEIFRVFKAQHPDVNIIALNTNKDIDRLIHLAKSGALPHQMRLFQE